MQVRFVTLLSLITVVLAQRKCGTPEPSEDFRKASAQISRQVAEGKANRVVTTAATIKVDTYFHVLRASESEGNLPDSALQEQLDVLNADYSSAGISFNLVEITRTTNSTWFHDQAEIEMKSELRQGGYNTLNVYFQIPKNSYLGYSYFPKSNPSSSDLTIDGASILYTTVPGGSLAKFNLGKTATHEIGHWFGLYHTFQDGCAGGDEVDDTPAEASWTEGCPVGKDTCTGSAYPGLDPIQNYMDYSDDACMTSFTAGQSRRMLEMYNTYRA